MIDVEPGYYWGRHKSKGAWVFGDWSPIRVALGVRGHRLGKPVIYTCGAAPNHSTRVDDWEIGERLTPPVSEQKP